MKNTGIFTLALFILLVACQKNDGKDEMKIIEKIKTVILDENWRGIKYDDGAVLYVPKKWREMSDVTHSTTYQINDSVGFFLDVDKSFFDSPSEFEEKLLNNAKDFKLQDNKILKMKFKNSNSTLYYRDVIGSKDMNFREITNFFMDKNEMYRFTITSEKPFDDSYVELLNLITNTYFVGEKRLIPIDNGYEKIEFLEPH